MINSPPFIPERFGTCLTVHAYAGGHASGHCPLILGIQGPSGFGKSYQARSVASSRGLLFSSISSSSLASTLESEPVELLETAYVQLSLQLQKEDCAGFMLLDDFDIGIAGIRSGTTYTVNSQLLTGFLMGLCDDPLLDRRLKRPVPIVITGNNLSVLHSPLTRHGRMEIFEWYPSDAERIDILLGIFGSSLRRPEVQIINEQFPDRPISFFRQLTVELWKNHAETIVEKLHYYPSYTELHSRLQYQPDYSIDSLIDLGKQLETKSRLPNYIAERQDCED